MLDPAFVRTKFALGLNYEDYVRTGKPHHVQSWKSVHERVRITEPQRVMIAGFTRRVNVLVLSGLWCGDCAQQCPMLDQLARVRPADRAAPTAPGVDLRFLDRDAHADLAERVMICGGRRVPTVLFLSEDCDFVSLMGDKTLSRLRATAARQLGMQCPLPGAPVTDDELESTVKDWAAELERAHLLLRLSTALRARHGD